MTSEAAVSSNQHLYARNPMASDCPHYAPAAGFKMKVQTHHPIRDKIFM